MILNQDTLTDFNKFYKGGFITLKETGPLVLKVSGVSGNMVKLHDVNNVQFEIDVTKGYEIDYQLPARKVYQGEDCAWMISRIPAKQYHRTITSSNVSLKLLQDGNWQQVALSQERLQFFELKPGVYLRDPSQWNPDYLKSVALDEHFSVDLTTGYVFCLDTLIGTYKNNKIKLITSMFTSELNTLIPGIV